MMMSKPAPKVEQETPAFAKKPEATKKKSAQEAVEDLERRLAMLGPTSAPAAPAAVAPSLDMKPGATAPEPNASAVKGGKNALLARIMAAQERTKQTQTQAKPEPQEDLLMTFDVPTETPTVPPPPIFDTSLIPPQEAPPAYDSMPPPSYTDMPPPFEAVQPPQMDFPAPPPIESLNPPTAMAPPAEMMPSAPALEDLLDSAPPAMHNPLEGMQVVPPPAAQPAIDEDVLAALSPEEREALLEEQRQIMEQIERNKKNDEASSAAARAMAFDQRSAPAAARAAAAFDRPATRSTGSSSSKSKKKSSSSSSGSGRTVNLGAGEEVQLHGQESTKKAIKDGTAILLQCVNCQNWMQVTKSAALMYCPVCQVVSPVEDNGASPSAADMDQASQMDADAKLAEQLQREEYKQAAVPESPRTRPQAQERAKQEDGQSWYDWLVGNPKQDTRVATPPRETQRGQASVSRPPGGALLAAQTDTINFSGSYDESEHLVRGRGGSGARVAEQKSLFSCVADSISTAATSLTAPTEDEEGNVHGVDSSSLLVMSQVSRQRD